MKEEEMSWCVSGESRGLSISPRHNFAPLPFLFRDDEIITLLSGTVKHHSNTIVGASDRYNL